MISALLPEVWRSSDSEMHTLSHKDALFADIKDLLSGALTDVTISVQDQKFSSHKTILSMRSPVFRAMFEQKMFESQSAKIVINDSGIDPQSFQEFLEYIYTGSIRLSSMNVLTILYLAKMHMLRLLEAECVQFIEQKVSAEDVLCVLEAARFMGEERVLALCWNIIRENCGVVLNSSHFCSVSLSVLEQLLSDDHLVIDEMILFQKVCEYIRNRSDVVDAIKIKHLMSLIRFGCISLKEIVEKVKPSGLLTNEQYIFALELHAPSSPDGSLCCRPRGKHMHRQGIDGLPLCFSRNSLGSGLSLSSDGRTVTGKAMLWRCARVELLSVRTFAISIIRTSFNPFVLIGFGPRTCLPDSWEGKGWYFHCAYNCFFTEGVYSARKYNRILLEGSIIQVTFNPRDQSLSFVVNGQQTLGTIFVKNSHEDIYPTVWLYGDVGVRLIDHVASTASINIINSEQKIANLLQQSSSIAPEKKKL